MGIYLLTCPNSLGFKSLTFSQKNSHYITNNGTSQKKHEHAASAKAISHHPTLQGTNLDLWFWLYQNHLPLNPRYIYGKTLVVQAHVRNQTRNQTTEINLLRGTCDSRSAAFLFQAARLSWEQSLNQQRNWYTSCRRLWKCQAMKGPGLRTA